ncbi:HWE histidine kinase domain-containing protein [Pararhizobium mangrovi]|uniref:histidine kinase n=1 Tax=Pararhizobium mangrovi TaxID=2590452 RepID=A0A506UHJ8_9HYPH|nr:HWE histidine kinase domain-containing protein [Pararhizobium mangrovi]TPW32781.1 GAF domain-containing protein [Pararhizobium mangrovi]
MNEDGIVLTDEGTRSRVLRSYDLLDTPREDDFDDLARLAADVCGTPIAVVNLVDTDRQFFKAEVGLGVRSSPLETSFCRHAMLVEEMLIVPDATKDSRFDGNALVHDAGGLRFYAGALLRTPDGIPIGTLCVLDHAPRTLDDRQVNALRTLARQVMTQIELRRVLGEERRATEALRAAQDRQNQLVREMSHRMKNTLSMVQAIVTQSLRRSEDVAQAREAISARLGAMARAQDILTTKDTSTALIGDVVETALSPHRTGQGGFAIAGPQIELTAPQALGLSLALHELATNAAKYGALSVEDGHVDIRWSGGEEELAFEWRETGGPPVVPPNERGFGSRLIERIVAAYFDGETSLDFDAGGVRFRLFAGQVKP